jgi:hypothetical protein
MIITNSLNFKTMDRKPITIEDLQKAKQLFTEGQLNRKFMPIQQSDMLAAEKHMKEWLLRAGGFESDEQVEKICNCLAAFAQSFAMKVTDLAELHFPITSRPWSSYV